ncbi:hypothetical protein RF11_11051 [Thelohanellus kitauei]|uniref:Uncharacterized protein n=1 Tax=Thelohanellus kitauei TaxID=669202 RepID=A0A0C2N647_THEKT|nr:hypothetical protein RF11_11051 [Thelohanellus kitauei]
MNTLCAIFSGEGKDGKKIYTLPSKHIIELHCRLNKQMFKLPRSVHSGSRRPQGKPRTRSKGVQCEKLAKKIKKCLGNNRSEFSHKYCGGSKNTDRPKDKLTI